MTAHRFVKSLAYVRVDAVDLGNWTNYIHEILGLEISPDSSDERLYVRWDERHHRLAISQGEVEDATSVGWEVHDAAALEAAVSHLKNLGLEVVRGTDDAARERRVMDFAWFRCPHTGVAVELVVGHELIFMPRFRPRRDLTGFKTGELGMGHVVFYAEDVTAASEFYVEALGFGISDYSAIPGIGPIGSFMHCNPRHHSMAFFPKPPGIERNLQHIMLETLSLDDVGSTYELCRQQGIVSAHLGRHHNSKEVSTYFENPSHWHFEYGWDGRLIDPDGWATEHYTLAPGLAWGHNGLIEMR